MKKEQLAMDMGPPNRGPGAMSWDCDKRGCFIDKSPNIGQFADCFPDKISPTNIDFFVELNNWFLFGEFKSPGVQMKDGQRRGFLALSRQPRTSFFIAEGTGPNNVKRYRLFLDGKEMPWVIGDMEKLKSQVRAWSVKVAPDRCF